MLFNRHERQPAPEMRVAANNDTSAPPCSAICWLVATPTSRITTARTGAPTVVSASAGIPPVAPGASAPLPVADPRAPVTRRPVGGLRAGC